MKNDPVRSNNSASKEANFFSFFSQSTGEESAFRADGRGVGLENTESLLRRRRHKKALVGFALGSDFFRSRSMFCISGGLLLFATVTRR